MSFLLINNIIIMSLDWIRKGENNFDKESEISTLKDTTWENIKNLTETKDDLKDSQNSFEIEVHTWKVVVPYGEASIDFLKDKENINYPYLEKVFKIYDGSFESIERIFKTLKDDWLERLKKFDWEIDEIFWQEFKDLLKELDKRFEWVSNDNKNLIKLNTWNKLKQFFLKTTLWLMWEWVWQIMEKIRGTSNFIIKSNYKIEKETQKAQEVNDISKEEFNYLMTNYSIQLILKYLIEKTLAEKTFEKNDKELFEARLTWINTQLATIAMTLKMSEWTNNQVDKTIISLNVAYENLISTLNTLISTTKNIQTLSDINNISKVLRELKKVSVEETAKWYMELLDQTVSQVNDDIEYHKKVQKAIKENIKKEAETEKNIEQLKRNLNEEEAKTEKLEKHLFDKLESKNDWNEWNPKITKWWDMKN